MRIALLVIVACTLGACHTTPEPMPPAADRPGTITGKVTFAGTPCQTPGGASCEGPRADYEVIVLAKDGTTVIGKTRTDQTGSYTIEVPAGEYTILTPAGLPLIPKKRNDVTVTAGAVATLDLRVDTGIR
jgi:hypothetical protein